MPDRDRMKDRAQDPDQVVPVPATSPVSSMNRQFPAHVGDGKIFLAPFGDVDHAGVGVRRKRLISHPNDQTLDPRLDLVCLVNSRSQMTYDS